MMKRTAIAAIGAVVLAACQPAIPDSGRGAGFGDDFVEQQRKRDAALATGVPAPAGVSSAPLDAQSAEATAAATTDVLNATRPGGVVNASPTNPPPAAVNAAGISAENNFDAVASQRSIDDDAARIAANKAQYQVVQPEALPSRSGSGPNVVAFALQTQNAVGQKQYRRIGINRAAKFQRVCAGFRSADDAQIAFLSQGGPERDRKGMDPDGDGFACSWDPTPFRRAAQQG